MKISRTIPAIVATLALAFSPVALAAKKKKDFSQFKGAYTGDVTLVYSGGTYSGAATIIVTVPKKATTATVSVSGSITPSGTPIAISTTFTLAKGADTTSDVLIGFGGATKLPATSSYAFSGKHSFILSPLTNVYTLSGSVTVSPQGKKKQKIVVTLTLLTPEQYVITFTGVGKAPKTND